MIKSQILKVLPYLLILGFFIAGYYGFIHIQNKLYTAIEENQILKNQVNLLKVQNNNFNENLNEWVENHSKLETIVVNLQNTTIKAQNERNRLNALFQKHNLEELAKKKPSLIENRINRGSSELVRLFNCSTRNTCPNNE